MYLLIKCPTCNNSIGEYGDIYEILKLYIYKKELKKKYNNNILSYQISMDSTIDIKLNDIFDICNISNYCCKRLLITNINYDSLLYSAINN